MIPVDTSVWIRFLAKRAPFAIELDRLLARDEVVGHELIYGELFNGDRGGRGPVLASYERMLQAELIPHREIADDRGAISRRQRNRLSAYERI